MFTKKLLILLAFALSAGLNLSSQTKYKINTSNWTVTTGWSNTAGGANCGCVPTSSDSVVINFDCTVNSDFTVKSISVTSAKVLTVGAGNTLTVTNYATINSTASLRSGGTSTMSVGESVDLRGCTIGNGTANNVTLSAKNIYFNGANSFLGNNTYIVKTGGTTNTWAGGNTFGSSAATTVYITNTAATTSGDPSIVMGNSGSADVFNAVMHFEVSGNGKIKPNYNTSAIFEENIYLKSTGSGGIYFSGGASGYTQLGTAASPNEPMISSIADLTGGTIEFKNFIQKGPLLTVDILGDLTESATVKFGPNAIFEGVVDCDAGGICFNGCDFQYDGTTDNTFEQGGNYTTSLGGNIFGGSGTLANSTTTIKVKEGGGAMYLADVTGDTYNNNVVFYVDGTSVDYGQFIEVCNGTSGMLFKGDIRLSAQAGSYSSSGYTYYNVPDGIDIIAPSGSPIVLAAGKVITDGTPGLNAAEYGINLSYITTPVGLAQNIDLEVRSIKQGAQAYHSFDHLDIGGNFDIDYASGDITNCTFRGTFDGTAEQTGAWADQTLSHSGNIWNGDITVRNATVHSWACSYGYKYATDYIFSYSAVETFNAGVTTITAINSGMNSNMTFSNGGGTTVYPCNIVLTNTGGGCDIRFGSSAGTSGASQLNSGKTITCAGGHVGGAITCTTPSWLATLTLRNFTQLGATAQNINGTSNCKTVYDNCNFAGNLSTEASMFEIKNSTFGGTATTFIHNGSGTTACVGSDGKVRGSSCYGGNTFNATTTTFQNNSRFYFALANSANDNINGNVVIVNTEDQLNSGICNPTSIDSSGIIFGGENGSGIVYLASGKTITIGAGGFDSGRLKFRKFQQLGSTAQSFTLTRDAAILYESGCVFNGNLTSSSSHVYLNGATFNGTATITRTEPTATSSDKANISTGGCTFNGTTEIINNATTAIDSMRLGTVSGDKYYGDITFRDNGMKISPAVAGSNEFKGNITVTGTGTSTMYFGLGGGTVLVNGTGAQNLYETGSMGLPIIPKLTINKTAGTTITLNTPVYVTNTLTMTQGLIATTSTNLLTLTNGSSVSPTGSGATDFTTSWVSGPVKKIGFTAATEFVFPTGKAGRSGRVSVIPTATSTTNAWTGEYYYGTAGGTCLPTSITPSSGINNVSYVEYWDLARTTGTDNARVGIWWEDKAVSGINHSQLADLRLAHCTGGGWTTDNITTYTTGTNSSIAGWLKTTQAFTSFSPFGFGSAAGLNPLPITLLSFTGENQGAANLLKWTTAIEIENNFFTLEKSPDGQPGTFTKLAEIDGAGNSTQESNYTYLDENPFDEITYYRLKQTDFNNVSKYSEVIAVRNKQGSEPTVDISPNPARSGAVVSMTINGLLTDKTVTYTILNNLGQKLYEGSVKHTTKYSVHPLSYMSDLIAPGSYTIRVVMDNETYKKVVIVH